jgi:subtilisin family serine protease
MKIFRALIYSLLLLFTVISVSAKNYVEGELLVKFANGTDSLSAARANEEIGANVLETFADLGWQRVKLPKNLSVETAIARYQNLADVVMAQPNYYYHLTLTPNDPQFTNSGMWGLTKISAPSAWDLATGSPTVVIANIDTGMKYDHEDLAANMWTNQGEINGNGIDDDGNGYIDDYYGYDFFFNDGDPWDEHGHGTHVGGTMGAVGNNNIGVVGVNWNVRLMAIKIYNNTGNGSTAAMLINAYNYVRIMKNRGVNIRVTNNSYGGCDEACGYDQATKDALDAMGNAGILNVFAAGNNGRNTDANPFYPASYTSPSILSVANSTTTDARNSSSNWGTTTVDLAAPGTGIYSTVRTTANYGTMTGTSMASPHVAGAAALLASYNPNLSPASLKATLMNTVDTISWSATPIKTSGRLNVDRALREQTVCNFGLSATEIYISSAGGNGSVNVFGGTNCDYPITSNVAWVTVTSPNNGSGNSTVNFTVQANPLPDAQRFGIISIADKTFYVIQGTPFLPGQRILDFDGDGRTDFAAIQNNGGGMIWHNQRSVLGYAANSFGLFNDDIPVANDFDGDGRTDIAVWRNSTGVFYVLRSSNNTFQVFQFGLPGDNPNISQDFDGDGKADFAVTRAQGNALIWYIQGSTAGFSAIQFGVNDDKPVRGDYDGDGRADLAVFRPSTGTWWIRRSSNPNNFLAFQFGLATDKLTPGDYDGDGKNDIAVWRETDGVWHYLKSSDGSYNAYNFGLAGDLPTPGDYDGDGRTDFAVWRPGANPNLNGIFYVQQSVSGFMAIAWGNSTMKIPANSMQSP